VADSIRPGAVATPTIAGRSESKGRIVAGITEVHIYMSFEADMDEDSANTMAEHFKNVVWKEAYETMQLPIGSVVAMAEHK
jgi:hypothetical protein